MLIAVEIIYADSLIALNLAADYLLLLAAGRLSGGFFLGAACASHNVYPAENASRFTAG